MMLIMKFYKNHKTFYDAHLALMGVGEATETLNPDPALDPTTSGNGDPRGVGRTPPLALRSTLSGVVSRPPEPPIPPKLK